MGISCIGFPGNFEILKIVWYYLYHISDIIMPDRKLGHADFEYGQIEILWECIGFPGNFEILIIVWYNLYHITNIVMPHK